MHRNCKKCGDSTGLFDNRPGAMYSESLVRSLQESVREGRQAKAILTDLIAELQDASTGYDPDCRNGCGVAPGAGCPTHYEEAAERAADRAEQRLREVSE